MAVSAWQEATRSLDKAGDALGLDTLRREGRYAAREVYIILACGGVP